MDGGLKLTDLVTFNLALKISWIKRLIKGIGNWQDIFEFTTGLNKTLVWDLDCLSLKKTSENIKNRFFFCSMDEIQTNLYEGYRC